MAACNMNMNMRNYDLITIHLFLPNTEQNLNIAIISQLLT